VVAGQPARTSIGARVTLFVTGTQSILGFDEVRTDFCYRSKRSPTLHFGLGPVQSVDVQVTTRDGQTKKFEGLPGDKTHVLHINPSES
jgi:hypothetical protein